jgi:hypothetical protein
LASDCVAEKPPVVDEGQGSPVRGRVENERIGATGHIGDREHGTWQFYSRQPVEPAFVEIVEITADRNFGEPHPIIEIHLFLLNPS